MEEIASSPGMCSSEELSPTQAILKKFKNARHLSSSEKEMYKEIRRQSHISAEQKRRGSIKVGRCGWLGVVGSAIVSSIVSLGFYAGIELNFVMVGYTLFHFT